MRPRVLCMVDLILVPEARRLLEQSSDVVFETPSRQTLLDRIHEFDALWSHIDLRIDAAVLRRARRLRVISCAATGTDHIDLGAAQRQGVRILSIARDYGLLKTFSATAELSWLLGLACCRFFRAATGSVLAGEWDSSGLRGEQLLGRTLGVLGVGRLGSMTVEYGKAFGMRVLACDLKPFSIAGVTAVDFTSLLRESDILHIHVHMTPQNYHLFNADTLARMKDGAVLINTSRGDVIDERALIEALKSKKLKAFGADVLHDEWREFMGDSPMVQYAREHDNVILTPHIGGVTTKSFVDARLFTARKLVHYLETGEELTME